MMNRMPSRVFGLILAIASVGVLFGPNPSRADDKDQEIQDLRSRLERLEKLLDQRGNTGLIPTVEPPTTGEVKDSIQDPKPKSQAEKKETEKKETEKIDDGWMVIGKDAGMKAKWDYGLWLATPDEAFRIHPAGRVQVDGIWANTTQRVQFGRGGIGPFDDAVNFRRVRLGADGWLYEVVDFNLQVDFVQTINDDPLLPPNAAVNIIPVPALTDCWVSINHIPWIRTVRIGDQKPPLLLEHLTSSRFLDFLERSPLFDINYHRNGGFVPGIQIFDWTENERMTWQLGLFKNLQTLQPWVVGDGDYQVNGRLTCLPWYREEGRYMMHLGVGVQYDAPEESVGAFFRERWLLRNGPPTTQNTVAQAIVNGHHQVMVAPEFFLNLGRFSIQSDYLVNHLDDISRFSTQTQGAVVLKGASKTFVTQGVYVQMMYFLTGENRPYNRTGLHSGEGAGPTRIVPLRNFFWVPGNCGSLFSTGAWQVGARYCYSDLSNNGIYGGQINEVTLGLNWFLNPNMKVQWNYDIGYRGQLGPGSNSNGTYQGLGTRVAFDF